MARGSSPGNRAAGRVIRNWIWVPLAALVLATAGWAVSSLSAAASGSQAGSVAATTSAVPILGVVGASGNYLAQERAAGVGAVTIGFSWSSAEPSPGAFSASYLQGIHDRIAAARSAGLDVVLDPGLQYPPSWVFALTGGTRFVNQYGDVFTGAPPSGNDVANAVTDAAVRAAEGSYLTWLGSQISPGEIIAVRQGGGPLGELRYPGPDYDGHTNSYWAYDTSTQSGSSVPGWRPGTGTVAQAQEFLDAYNAALDGYGQWLNAQLHQDFNTNELVMLPGWGERPGGAAKEVTSLLTVSMPEFNEGLDWTGLLDSLPDPSQSVAYTTYLDAPTVMATPQLEDPADYIASLVAGTGLRLGGENTGNGTIADMDLSLDRAKALHYYIVQWMDEAQLIASGSGEDPGGPTLDELGSAWTSTPVGSNVTGGNAADLAAPIVGTAAGPAGEGYWIADAAGGVEAFGEAGMYGSMAGHPLNAAINHIVATPDGRGYWLVAADGGTFAFGDAGFYGSMGDQHLNAPVVDIAPTNDGKGYWLVASDGGVFAFGDAAFHGSMGGIPLNEPVVGVSQDDATGGYWLVASDGGIFAFDAKFLGSTGDLKLNMPVNGMASTADSGGYWLVASDGGIFAFGDAAFHGSTGGIELDTTVVGISPDVATGGYWLVASDGAIYSEGAPSYGAA
jgi:hypothetical protein